MQTGTRVSNMMKTKRKKKGGETREGWIEKEGTDGDNERDGSSI